MLSGVSSLTTRNLTKSHQLKTAHHVWTDVFQTSDYEGMQAKVPGATTGKGRSPLLLNISGEGEMLLSDHWRNVQGVEIGL